MRYLKCHKIFDTLFLYNTIQVEYITKILEGSHGYLDDMGPLTLFFP